LAKLKALKTATVVANILCGQMIHSLGMAEYRPRVLRPKSRPPT